MNRAFEKITRNTALALRACALWVRRFTHYMWRWFRNRGIFLRALILISLIGLSLLAWNWTNFMRFVDNPGLFFRNIDRAQEGISNDILDGINIMTGAHGIMEDLRLDNVDLSSENAKLRQIVAILNRRLLEARADMRKSDRTQARLRAYIRTLNQQIEDLNAVK